MAHYTLFDSAIGTCGLAWHDHDSSPRILAVGLPERRPDAVARRLARVYGATPAASGPVADVVAGICGHVSGTIDDLRWVDVDLDSVTDFDRAVYHVTRRIDPGRTLSYGEVARQIGHPGAAQAVGQALGRNPIPLIIPCHRGLGAGNSIGGFSAFRGTATKRALLEIEGVAGFTHQALFGLD
ncbi:methylated-DNA--[protein]-cysteine S-methyltransferase [Skermania sp. ID1734]|uniref:methylated-DNA--[protein]-cysteine S-methyltransferase n=1 Tax=Skermania sp. ID1734 TaxID=2597516 RepID=UPI0011810AE0|nr:methylated-DNA--[protein]-cysteine S-methyltransferase [Skermania sp. ID1734]TSD94419.1 methylated-DNA--[protein]-cysteine S-methyltransferase [Skermania sp. ID1734]